MIMQIMKWKLRYNEISIGQNNEKPIVIAVTSLLVLLPPPIRLGT